MLALLSATLATVPALTHPTTTALIAVRVQVVQSCTVAFDRNVCRGASGRPPVRVIHQAGRTIYEF